MMQNKNPWFALPSHLNGATTRSLSLIFIIDEIAQVFETIQDFKMRIERQNSLDLLVQDMKEYFFSNEQFFPNKLYSYCDTLTQICQEHFDPPSCPLQKLDEIQILLLKLKRTPLSFFPTLLSALNSLREMICSFFFTLCPYLQFVKTDEKVLLCLIEHRKKLNHNLGQGTIDQILRGFFPSGRDEMRKILFEKFAKRGFSSFFAEKEHLIAELEWETSCPMNLSQ